MREATVGGSKEGLGKEDRDERDLRVMREIRERVRELGGRSERPVWSMEWRRLWVVMDVWEIVPERGGSRMDLWR